MFIRVQANSEYNL